MLPPSDSDEDDEDEAPAPKKGGQVLLSEELWQAQVQNVALL